MITNRQRNILILFISKALFLGVGYSLILSNTNNDSWICAILGSILGLIFCFFIKKILNKRKDVELTEYLKSIPFLGNIIRFLLIIISIIIINEIFFIIKEFASTFFLINTKSYLIVLPLLLLVIYIAFKGYNLLSYISEAIFPICLFLLLFAFISLVFNVDYSNIKPILSHSNINMVKSTFFYFSLSTSPLIFLLDMNFKDNNFYNTYIVSSIIVTIIFIFLVGILGEFLSTTYRFPEYMILKNIKMLNFIEKIENILSITYIIDEFILLCFSSIFLKRMLPKKYNNYSFLFIIVFIFIISCKFFGNNFLNDSYVYLYLPYILTFIAIPIILILLITKKRDCTLTYDK